MLSRSFQPRPLNLLLALLPYGPAFADGLRQIHPSLPDNVGHLDELDHVSSIAAIRYALSFACQTQNVANIELGRAALIAAPRDWVLARLVSAARAELNLEDPWEVRRLLEIASELDQSLLQTLLADFRGSHDAEIREAAADFALDDSKEKR